VSGSARVPFLTAVGGSLNITYKISLSNPIQGLVPWQNNIGKIVHVQAMKA